MHKLSKITHNKAARNGLEFYISEEKERGRLVSIVEILKLGADEYLVAYCVNVDGSYTYHSSASHQRDNDMPGHIKGEQTLRDLLPEFARV